MLAKVRIRYSYISLPLLYSSGASVVIKISRGPDNEFIVSDMGSGFQEATRTGADHHYTRAANAVAAKAGVRSDGQVISDSGISREQLVVAVTVIGNCSLEAWSLAEHRNVERKRLLAADQFYTRIFTTVKRRDALAEVVKDVSVRGNSSSEWEFDVSVIARSEQALFGIVSPNAQSVAFATTKCSDVGRLAEPPKLFSVVENKKAMGNRLGWLLPVSTVIEGNEPDDVLIRLMPAVDTNARLDGLKPIH